MKLNLKNEINKKIKNYGDLFDFVGKGGKEKKKEKI